MSRESAWLDAAWLVAFGIASSLWCLTAARELGATFDEPLYVTRGLEDWRSGSHAGLLRLGTMPLAIDVDTLPLHLRERARGVPFDASTELAAILPSARAGTLVFWWILLAYAGLGGRRLAGRWGGRVAIALVATEPLLLGHASLATVDVPVAACLLALTVHFSIARERSAAARIVVPGLWYGAALLAKASALVFGPICLLAAGAAELRPAAGRARPLVRDVAAITALGLALALLYCGSDWQVLPSFVAWADALPEGPGATAMRGLARGLTIFPNAGEGLVRQVKHGIRGHGHGAYLLGEVRDVFWIYFPAALSMKLGLALLALPLIVVCVRPAALVNPANQAALALLVMSVFSRVQIGVRFYLPLVALAATGLGAASVAAIRSLAGWQRQTAIALLGAAIGWNGWSAVAAWPHGLCHVNELWGGAERGHLLLSDSNCDWGQGLGELDRWHFAAGRPPLDVWYFGSDPFVREMPVRLLPLHVLPIEEDADVLDLVRGRHLAASLTFLYGTHLGEGHRRAAAFLRSREPVARTTTFFVYDFTSEMQPPGPP